MIPKNLRVIALGAALLVPFGLLHAFVLAEICIAITDVLFVVTMVRDKNLAWARQPWLIAAIIWWVWLLICSTPLPGIGLITAGWNLSFLQAFVIIRLILFTVALQTWLLTTASARRFAWLMLAFSCLWIGLESWQQYLTGSNIFGHHRWADGSLTGPFWKPRAGQLYAHLTFTALLPVALAMFAKPGTFWRATGIALTVLAIVTSVLIGQRMGTALNILGLCTAALFISQIRRAALIAFAMAALVLLATPILSPPTHAKLVGETTRNFTHFSQSPYGEIFTRATVMGLASPWHGWGYNGYREFCPRDKFNGGLPALGIPPTQLGLAACIEHPQNYYIQAFADAGFPGLALFIILNLVWLLTLARGLWKNPDPLRTGLLIGVLTFSWPIASTDAFPALYMLGWLFFLLGLGLSLAHIPAETSLSDLQNA